MTAEATATKLTVFQHALWIMSRWPGPVRVTQRSSTKRNPKTGETDTVLIDVLHWTGTLTPSRFSPTYKVEFTYIDDWPTAHVQVVTPRLDPGHGDELPHMYTNLGGLCLHDQDQWDESMPIATSMIPWTSEWLFHYELWRATGTWTGGGDLHEQTLRPADGRRLRSSASP